MKNRNIQFKAAALSCKSAGLFLASLAGLFISAPNPASARDQVPFNGVVAGYNNPPSGTQCEPLVSVVNFGHANQLGAFTGTAEFFPRPCEPDPNLCANNIPDTLTFDWFAANGDEIYGTFQGYLCPTETPGVFDNHETAEVTGGTGRFTNAIGHFELARATRAVLCSSLARRDLKCRLEETALDIAGVICASHLVSVQLRCAKSMKRSSLFSS